jgi:hypothetical protein
MCVMCGSPSHSGAGAFDEFNTLRAIIYLTRSEDVSRDGYIHYISNIITALLGIPLRLPLRSIVTNFTKPHEQSKHQQAHGADRTEKLSKFYQY